ncbi:MAG: hypothetical protein AAFW81_06515 [Pseudomonadota bacterium]
MTEVALPEALAAVWMLAVACLHAFVGSRTDVRPFLESDTPEPAKSTVFYCWHIVTLILLAMAGLFAISAIAGGRNDLTWTATSISLAFAILGFFIGAMRRQSLITKMPQGFLFLVSTALGGWALITV